VTRADDEEDEREARIRAAVERFFAANPDAGVIDALGTLTLSPDRRELVEDVKPDTDASTGAESGSESAGEESESGGDDQSGTRVVHRSEPHDVYIGRGRGGDGHLKNTEIGETGWLGNPYKLDDGYSRKQSLALYWADLSYRIEHDPEFSRALARLKGQRLACYCRSSHEDEPACHGDVLVRAIEGLRPVDESAARDESADGGPPAVSEPAAGSAVGSVGGER
jgi:hypothetical protein